jgi:phosphoglycerate dehydrogenase-like enzyme
MRSEAVSVAILDDYQNVALSVAPWNRLPANVAVLAFNDHVTDRDALIARLAPFDVIVAMRERTQLLREVIEALPNLKLIVTTGSANAAIDIAACKERGVPVCGTGALHSPTVELTWGLIIALLRHIPAEDAAIRLGNWQSTIGVGLEGKTLAVLGLGHLGSRVARIGAAFEMNVIAWSQNLTETRAVENGAQRVEKDELFEQADVLTIHVVLSKRTRGLVGARELALMKPSAYLVNTSRGPIVDEVALIDALTNGKLAGAALDVFNTEPLPVDHPLRSLPNTVITPHLGYVTIENYEVYYRDALADIEAWLAGNPLRLLY